MQCHLLADLVFQRRLRMLPFYCHSEKRTAIERLLLSTKRHGSHGQTEFASMYMHWACLQG